MVWGRSASVRKPCNKDTERLLRLALPGRTRIFDAGCGAGEIAFWLAEAGGHVIYAVDPRLPLVEGQWYRVTDLSDGEVFLMRRRAETVSDVVGIECVLALGLLHSLGDANAVAAMLKTLCAMMQPGGRVALSWVLETRSADGRNVDAYYPSADHVESLMAQSGYSLSEKWFRQVNHSHSGAPHSHFIAYTLWMNG